MKFRWILGSTDFTFLIATRFIVAFSTQIQAVAVGWLVYQIKQDPLYLGLIGLTEAAPALGLALFSGWVVDRSRPLIVYRRAVACSTISAFVLWLVASDIFKLNLSAQLIAIFAAAFLTGIARSFMGPSTFSILPQTVPRHQLSTATAWSSSFYQIASLSGPALGGFLYAFSGGGCTFLTILLLLVMAQVVAMGITKGRQHRKASSRKAPMAEGLLTGVKFVFSNQIILAALSLDMFGVLFGGAEALLPIFARDIFNNGPVGLGILRAALPLGSFLMGIFLIRFPISRFSGKVMLYAFLGFGLCMTGFGLSNSFALSCGLLLVTGMCDSISVVVRSTILQVMTPEEMRGRVASVNAIFIGSSNEIGAFESGLAAKLMGTRASIVFGGCMTLLVLATTWIRAPKLRKIHLSQL